MAEKAGVPGGFLIGAGAGSHTFLGANSEVREHHMIKAKYYYVIIPRNRCLLLLDVNPSITADSVLPQSPLPKSIQVIYASQICKEG